MERISGPRTASPLAMFRDPAWCVALAACIAFAIAVRGAMLFRGEVPAGVDAGYYAVQARELLLLGKLRWADVPLTFLLDAALAKMAMLVCGWDIDTATIWATRVVDAAAEPLVGVAVFVAAWTFARGARGAIVGAVAVAIAVTVSPPLLRMVGDFEKQSMAYVFMAGTWTCAWLAMRAADRRGMFRWSAAALVMLGLTALTHAGTFAATGLGAVLVFAVWVMRGGIPRGMALRALPVLALAGGLAYGTVWWLAPGKAMAISSLVSALISGEGGGSGAGGVRGPGGPGGVGGPGGPRAPALGGAWPLALATGLAFAWWITRRLRCAEAEVRAAARADEALLFGMVLVAAFLTCPLLSGDQSMRLALMLPMPLAFVATFVFCQRADADTVSPFARATRWAIQRPVASLAAAALAVSAVAGTRGRTPEVVDAEGMVELRSWRADVAPGDRAVVAARHGLEFWAAFAMDTHARWGTLKQEDFDRYDRFFILEERSGRRGEPGEFGGLDGAMEDDLPPHRRDQDDDMRSDTPRQRQQPRPDSGSSGRPDRRRAERTDEMAGEGPRRRGGPPNGMGGPGGPGGRGGPGGPGGRGGRPGGGPGNDPMAVASVPREARIVKQSDRFTLWEVPASAREQFPTREQANSRTPQRLR